MRMTTAKYLLNDSAVIRPIVNTPVETGGAPELAGDSCDFNIPS